MWIKNNHVKKQNIPAPKIYGWYGMGIAAVAETEINIIPVNTEL
jgi:hypothetical protein|tara:strand:- start:8184 stop:8315 length:132 start_codon:yes stop_codon:yes gene_type:complete